MNVFIFHKVSLHDRVNEILPSEWQN